MQVRMAVVGAVLLIFFFLTAPGCGRNTRADSSEESGNTEAVADSGKTEEHGKHDGKGDTAKADSKTEDGESDEEEAVPVDVAVLTRGPMESIIRSSANLEAEDQIEVAAEAARRVTEILVEEGDLVHEGQVLLRLQSDEQRSNLARVKSQLARAEREKVRQERLHEQNLSSEKTYNDALYELDQQQIALADAERELSYTEVRAPISGTITARLIDTGDQVQVGQHLFDIVDFETLVARIYVPEKNLKALRVGQPARLYARALSNDPYSGSVLRISPVIDPRSGTIKVTVAVAPGSGLRPGLYADVELITAVENDALMLPKRALVYADDQIFAYRLKEDRRVERLLVVPGLASKDDVEPLRGFAEGDSVIVAGQAGLKDGTLVELVAERDRKKAEKSEGGKSEGDGTASASEADGDAESP